MSGESALLTTDPSVVSVGAGMFADALAAQAVPVTRVGFRPPMGDGSLDDALVRVLADPRRAAANATAVERVLAVRPQLVDVRPAGEALGLEAGDFLHAGPPVDWERASGPLRGALMGAMVFEGLAADPDAAERALASGAARLDSCHHHAAVGPMAGVISPSMWVFELADPATGRRSWCSLNEGLGRVLRYGAYGPEVIDRLRWMSAVLGPLLRDAVRAHGPVDIGAIVAQMLQMGDEGHNRNRAGTLMLLREVLPELVGGGAPASDVAEAVRFVSGNDHFFLNLVMPGAKLMMDAGRDVPGSTMVVAMARNGTDFGVQVSGTGDTWFTAPAELPDGLYLGSYGPDDANPDIGDSTIAETAGIGGFVMATAPAIVRFVGGDVDFALATSRSMYEITLAENPAFQLPILDFRGAPTGIDVAGVVRTGVLPQINTGMAGRVPGTGQVGAGLVNPPARCFALAMAALAEAAPPLSTR
ncbi:hypothetical protein HDA32_001221 [Spinactinospora alkalitolerans]|uniref:DUF1116 domain-containing protein n=1 Tax=Spinactinospora alkalitolerans TaxID=687207 RepID=A0A852TRB2_9ACTN|nr:DUF1116 domain-containing protein [Spinactinospora alkalitolerans]NYE46101.1 hypothetical protein [Spinactinospora alkalitolerans]